MPSYFFHLSFELRDQPHLTSSPRFRPPPNLNLFTAKLPVHRDSTWSAPPSPYISGIRRLSALSNGSNPDPPTAQPAIGGHLPPPLQPAIGRPKLASSPRGQLHTKPSSPRKSTGDSGSDDWRLGEIYLESIDMKASLPQSSGPGGGGTTPMKGKYIPGNPKTTDIGWGVVHLYKDLDPSPEISQLPTSFRHRHAEPPARAGNEIDEDKAYVDVECTTLCILAVPTYMTPSDLLGWVGEDTRERVTHFRLVRTARSNKYMVLMKFREAKDARRWHQDWNGKLFNSTEPENCHVVFIKSINFQSLDDQHDPFSFPDISNDPFTPPLRQPSGIKVAPASTEGTSAAAAVAAAAAAARPANASLTTKPAPPPTPALIELPTCPVCLERMDDTTGLATIFCQHVFHCACLQKWRGSGCPVCRYTQSDPLNRARGEGRLAETECRQCRSGENLWICLICGNVGCGRYDEAHAFEHYQATSHSFAMDIATQHIWDYVGDEYVHRLIQNKSDGKLVELPSAMTDSADNFGGDMVPRDKLENMSMEYTYLLTAQLDNQRRYFEEQIERAADKAAKASAAAEAATEATATASRQLQNLQSSQTVLEGDTVPALEKGKERAERRAEKSEALARKMEKEWREKEVINESLMARISFLEKQCADAQAQLDTAHATVRDLEEQNRDLSFFISGAEKLRGQGADVQEGTVTVAETPGPSGPAKKGKKKK